MTSGTSEVEKPKATRKEKTVKKNESNVKEAKELTAANRKAKMKDTPNANAMQDEAKKSKKEAVPMMKEEDTAMAAEGVPFKKLFQNSETLKTQNVINLELKVSIFKTGCGPSLLTLSNVTCLLLRN